MTIDEAIKHCEEVAEKLEKKANIYEIKNTYLPDSQKPVDCLSCAADHRQLAEWLMELKEAKRLLKLAVENMNDGGCTRSCSTCKYGREGCKYTVGYEWVHTKEAAKLLKEAHQDSYEADRRQIMEIIKDCYISKLEVVRILQKAYAEGRISAIDDCASVLDDINVADSQPVKRGFWKDIMMSEATGWDLSLTGGRDAVCKTVCSVCGEGCAFGGDGELYLSPYCPNCGADMRGDTNG